jgi:hypothetical protein
MTISSDLSLDGSLWRSSGLCHLPLMKVAFEPLNNVLDEDLTKKYDEYLKKML